MNERVFQMRLVELKQSVNRGMKKAFGSWDISISAWFACGSREGSVCLHKELGTNCDLTKLAWGQCHLTPYEASPRRGGGKATWIVHLILPLEKDEERAWPWGC